jgi:hypothetical protein
VPSRARAVANQHAWVGFHLAEGEQLWRRIPIYWLLMKLLLAAPQGHFAEHQDFD